MIEEDPPQREDGRRPVRNRRENHQEFRTHLWSPGSPAQIEERVLLTVSRYAKTGNIAEVFIDYPNTPGVRKPGDRPINMGKDIATLISIAIQYGAPVELLRDAMGRGDVNLMGKAEVLPHTLIGTVLDFLLEQEKARKG